MRVGVQQAVEDDAHKGLNSTSSAVSSAYTTFYRLLASPVLQPSGDLSRSRMRSGMKGSTTRTSGRGMPLYRPITYRVRG
jgi:hypothetical protein